MNLICTPLRTSLSESNLDRFMRISINGPETFGETDVEKMVEFSRERMTIDALIYKIYFLCFFWCLIFVLKVAFHFGSFIYRSVSGMRPLSSVNNGSDSSKQFSFTLKSLSHCSIFVYFSDVFTFFLCLFIFSIREYSCNVSQTYLRVQKKNDCCIIFYCIFTLGNVFLRFSQKNSKLFGGFTPWTPTRALPWTHWGGGGSQCPPDPKLMFYVPSARSFFASQKTDAPIFFLYYPLITQTDVITLV